MEQKLKHILIIIGSERTHSFNRAIALYTKKALMSKSEVSILDYSALPFINQDLENNLPEEVKRVKEKVKKADILWFFTPEYNQSYPGAVKNLIDWLSRPETPGDYSSGTAIKGKKCIITSAAGKSKGMNVINKIEELLSAVKAEITTESLGIQIPPASFSSDIMDISEEVQKSIEKQCSAALS